MRKTGFSILLFFTSYFINSQCFDCGHSIGGHVEDYVVDIDTASDGIVLTINPQQGWGRSIHKYDFNCNLIWANNFIPDNGFTDGMGFYNTTVDENDNIYSVIANNRGGVIVDGFPIEMGNSLVKLNPGGKIQWVRKISDERYLPRQVHVWSDYVFVVGQLDEGINTNIGFMVLDGFESQYFIAKFDTSGNLIAAEQYGAGFTETLHDSQIDEDGNIYFTGSVIPISHSENIKTYLTKVDSNLETIWFKEMSDNDPVIVFKPMTLYYNENNQKLYVWSKYVDNASFYGNTITTSNGCNIGSVIMEVSKDSGDLENYKVNDNCGFFDSVGNGIGHVEQRGFITHEGSNLYVLSSFRGAITIGSETLTTTRDTHGEDNSDLILFKIDLTDFTEELILRSTGENYYPSAVYHDLAGPLVAVNNSIHITSSFMSHPITINDTPIVNNSGNNARDILYYKHNLDQSNPVGLITFEKTCLSQSTEFLIGGDFDSVLWNFDDPASGSDNTSTLTDPIHTFTSSGTYHVSAMVTCGTETETIEVEVIISSSPVVNQIDDLHACEDSFGSQLSGTFDTSSIQNDLIGNQTNLFIRYFDENKNELPSPLPNPMSNSVLGQELITARVAYVDNASCFTEVSFNLIVEPLPKTLQLDDIYACDDNSDGITVFDVSHIETTLLAGQSGMTTEYFHENGQQLPDPLPDSISNVIQNQETITARISNPNTLCYNETTFKLIVNPLPVTNPLELIGCDDNNDGISEYFDTSNVEQAILNGQTGMQISYYDGGGNLLPYPLPNPYTNKTLNEETITVRVTNIQTSCYAETPLILRTSDKPQINTPTDLYACDEGNGISTFDLSGLENDIIGTQPNLNIFYYDASGNDMTSQIDADFQNTQPWSQSITLRVENASNPACFSETSFKLIVNALPEITLEERYFLCDLEPELPLVINETMDFWEWRHEDGSILSNSNEVNLAEAGPYELTIGKLENGILCQNSYDFELIRSVLPTINNIDYQDLSDNNFIVINASGDGSFEYSIDGMNYQDSHEFQNVLGGIYTVSVRDKLGCGEDSQQLTLIDCPKFFTPNGDNHNDYWQVRGVTNHPNAKIFIYDRYGKLLKQITSNSVGWDGTSHGEKMPSDDYWFMINLDDGRLFKGHFTLKR